MDGREPSEIFLSIMDAITVRTRLIGPSQHKIHMNLYRPEMCWDMALLWAGIAAGGRDEVNEFTGAAPDADLVVVKLKPAKEYLKQFYLIREDGIRFIRKMI